MVCVCVVIGFKWIISCVQNYSTTYIKGRRPERNRMCGWLWFERAVIAIGGGVNNIDGADGVVAVSGERREDFIHTNFDRTLSGLICRTDAELCVEPLRFVNQIQSELK